MQAKTRKIIRKIHLFFGLTLGVMFSFMGLTGGVLVFEHEIDEWLNPDFLVSSTNLNQHTDIPKNIDKILASAIRFNPSFRVKRIETPRTEEGVYLLRGNHQVKSEIKPLSIYVDPIDYRATGARVWGEYPLSFIYKLHYTLLMGEWGSAIVGFSGLFLLLMTFTGIVLWWPKKGKWLQAVAIKWQAKKIRIIWDLHRSSGFFSSIFLVVISFSGVYMIFPEYIKPMVNLVSPLTSSPAKLTSVYQEGVSTLSPSNVEDISESIYPDTALKRIYFPDDELGVYRVIRRENNSAIKSSGFHQVWIDQYSGKVLATRRPEDFTYGDYFIALQFPLHNGEAFGLFGRVLVLLVSLTPTLLLISGFLIWRGRRVNKPQYL